jgi:hypothetical protein
MTSSVKYPTVPPPSSEAEFESSSENETGPSKMDKGKAKRALLLDMIGGDQPYTRETFDEDIKDPDSFFQGVSVMMKTFHEMQDSISRYAELQEHYDQSIHTEQTNRRKAQSRVLELEAQNQLLDQQNQGYQQREVNLKVQIQQLQQSPRFQTPDVRHVSEAPSDDTQAALGRRSTAPAPGLVTPLPPQSARPRTHRSLSPIEEPVPHRGSFLKIPDPAKLVDNTTPTFENWEKSILTKFQGNAHLFPTESLRMSYIWNLTGGEAQQHLSPRFMSGDPSLEFSTAADMLDALRVIYVDPNFVEIKKGEFGHLTMTANETFNHFLTRFTQLAGEAQIASTEYRFHLLSKITDRLQDKIVATKGHYTTFRDLADHLLGVDQGMRYNRTRELAQTGTTTRTGTAKSFVRFKQPLTTTTTGTPAPKTLFGSKPAQAALPTTATTVSGNCRGCGAKGHWIKDCPKKNNAISSMSRDELAELLDELVSGEKETTPEQISEDSENESS